MIDHLFVIPCGAAKLDHAAPARELYTGSLFRQALAAVEREAGETEGSTRVVILSALHGLVDPDRTLDPYDMTIGHPDSVRLGRLADQLQEHEPGDVWAFLPAAYLARLRDAAWLYGVRHNRHDRQFLVHDVYEAAPGIGHHKRVLANLRKCRATPDPAGRTSLERRTAEVAGSSPVGVTRRSTGRRSSRSASR